MCQKFLWKIEISKDQEIEISKDQEIEISKYRKIERLEDWEIKRSKDWKIEKSKYQKIEISKDRKIERSKDRNIKRSKYQKIERAIFLRKSVSKCFDTLDDFNEVIKCHPVCKIMTLVNLKVQGRAEKGSCFVSAYVQRLLPILIQTKKIVAKKFQRQHISFTKKSN
jgi:hypothetical protein